MTHTEEANAYLSIARTFGELLNGIASIKTRDMCEYARNRALALAAQAIGALETVESNPSGRESLLSGLSEIVAGLRHPSDSAYVPSFFAEGKSPGVSVDEPSPDDANGWRWFRAGREQALDEVQDILTAASSAETAGAGA